MNINNAYAVHLFITRLLKNVALLNVLIVLSVVRRGKDRGKETNSSDSTVPTELAITCNY